MLAYTERYAASIPNFRGVIAQAPAIEPTKPIPIIVYALLKFINYCPILGQYTSCSNLDTSNLSEEELLDLKINPLLHQKISFALSETLLKRRLIL